MRDEEGRFLDLSPEFGRVALEGRVAGAEGGLRRQARARALGARLAGRAAGAVRVSRRPRRAVAAGAGGHRLPLRAGAAAPPTSPTWSATSASASHARSIGFNGGCADDRRSPGAGAGLARRDRRRARASVRDAPGAAAGARRRPRRPGQDRPGIGAELSAADLAAVIGSTRKQADFALDRLVDEGAGARREEDDFVLYVRKR